jgi:poly(hydroxyalkanoate) depolymerase family esterase
MVLHGCNQTHETIKHDTDFDSLADQEGFAVVYPFITSDNLLRIKNCWGFWLDEHIHEGSGEVQDLRSIIEEVQRDYQIDPNRIHITGLSSGAGMTVAALVAHSELFASGASTAGLPYSETESSVGYTCFNPGKFKSVPQVAAAMKSEIDRDPPQENAKRVVPILAIHSTDDCTVNIKASENIRDSFLQLWQQGFGLDFSTLKITEESGVTKGTPWTLKQYAVEPGSRTIAETLFVEGLAHGWYGNRDGQYAFANAPNTAQLVWDFFKSHPFNTNQPPTVTIERVTADQQQRNLTIAGTATDPDGSVAAVRVELLGRYPQGPEAAELKKTDNHYSYSSTIPALPNSLPNNTVYRPLVTASDNEGVSSQKEGSRVIIGELPPAPEVTITQANADLDCITLRGTAADDTGVTSVEVRFNQGNWLSANLDNDSWFYNACNFADGTYQVEAKATDVDGLEATALGSLTVTIPYDAKELADLSTHVATSRIRTYQSGFGAADSSYLELFNQHGVFEQFWLYRAKETNNWYADISQIPPS